jgi:hypothetical protein
MKPISTFFFYIPVQSNEERKNERYFVNNSRNFSAQEFPMYDEKCYFTIQKSRKSNSTFFSFSHTFLAKIIEDNQEKASLCIDDDLRTENQLQIVTHFHSNSETSTMRMTPDY